MRRSSSASWLMGRLFCRIKALRSKTSRLMPSRVSPQAAPVRPGTGSLVPAYTALNSPMGLVCRRVARVRVSSPSSVPQSIRPDMAAPDQGAKRFLSAIKPARSRSRLLTPYKIESRKAHQVDFPVSLGASMIFRPSPSSKDRPWSLPKVAVMR